jgi:diacylglycerol kinase (ATP)
MSDSPARSLVAPGHACIISNPAAGGGEHTDGVRAAVGVFAEHGWTVSLHRTAGVGHARELAAAAAERGVAAVIVAAGDGTVNEVVNGLVGSTTALGVLPAGTGNVFAAQLGLIGVPTPLHRPNLAEAATAVCASVVRRIDLGFAQPRCRAGRHFLLWAGIGLDAAVTHALEGSARELKRLLGPAAFGAIGLRSALGLTGTPAAVRYDDQRIRGPLLMAVVANVPLYAGGVRLAPGARIDDARLDLLLFMGADVVSATVAELGSILAGHRGDTPQHVAATAAHVRIVTRAPAPVHVDAEPFGTTPITFSIRPRALALLVPPTAPADLFAAESEAAG